MKNLLFIFLMLAMLSCNNDQPTPTVNHDASIEVQLEVVHDSFHDIIITKKKIWTMGVERERIHYDTIPSLDSIYVQNEDGNSQKIRNFYDLYITVK